MSIRVGGVGISFIPTTFDGVMLDNVAEALDYAHMLNELADHCNAELNSGRTLPVTAPQHVTAAQPQPLPLRPSAPPPLPHQPGRVEMTPEIFGFLSWEEAQQHKVAGSQFVAPVARIAEGRQKCVELYMEGRQYPDIVVRPAHACYPAALNLLTQPRTCKVVWTLGNPKKTSTGFYYDPVAIL